MDVPEPLFSDPHEAVEWMRQWASTLTYEGDKLLAAAGLLEDSYNDFRNEEERADELEKTLQEIADHPVVSEDPGNNCDWHCTSTMVARAKDALAK